MQEHLRKLPANLPQTTSKRNQNLNSNRKGGEYTEQSDVHMMPSQQLVVDSSSSSSSHELFSSSRMSTELQNDNYDNVLEHIVLKLNNIPDLEILLSTLTDQDLEILLEDTGDEIMHKKIIVVKLKELLKSNDFLEANKPATPIASSLISSTPSTPYISVFLSTSSFPTIPVVPSASSFPDIPVVSSTSSFPFVLSTPSTSSTPLSLEDTQSIIPISDNFSLNTDINNVENIPSLEPTIENQNITLECLPGDNSPRCQLPVDSKICVFIIVGILTGLIFISLVVLAVLTVRNKRRLKEEDEMDREDDDEEVLVDSNIVDNNHTSFIQTPTTPRDKGKGKGTGAARQPPTAQKLNDRITEQTSLPGENQNDIQLQELNTTESSSTEKTRNLSLYRDADEGSQTANNLFSAISISTDSIQVPKSVMKKQLNITLSPSSLFEGFDQDTISKASVIEPPAPAHTHDVHGSTANAILKTLDNTKNDITADSHDKEENLSSADHFSKDLQATENFNNEEKDENNAKFNWLLSRTKSKKRSTSDAADNTLTSESKTFLKMLREGKSTSNNISNETQLEPNNITRPTTMDSIHATLSRMGTLKDKTIDKIKTIGTGRKSRSSSNGSNDEVLDSAQTKNSSKSIKVNSGKFSILSILNSSPSSIDSKSSVQIDTLPSEQKKLRHSSLNTQLKQSKEASHITLPLCGSVEQDPSNTNLFGDGSKSGTVAASKQQQYHRPAAYSSPLSPHLTSPSQYKTAGMPERCNNPNSEYHSPTSPSQDFIPTSANINAEKIVDSHLEKDTIGSPEITSRTSEPNEDIHLNTRTSSVGKRYLEKFMKIPPKKFNDLKKKKPFSSEENPGDLTDLHSNSLTPSQYQTANDTSREISPIRESNTQLDLNTPKPEIKKRTTLKDLADGLESFHNESKLTMANNYQTEEYPSNIQSQLQYHQKQLENIQKKFLVARFPVDTSSSSFTNHDNPYNSTNNMKSSDSTNCYYTAAAGMDDTVREDDFDDSYFQDDISKPVDYKPADILSDLKEKRQNLFDLLSLCEQNQDGEIQLPEETLDSDQLECLSHYIEEHDYNSDNDTQENGFKIHDGQYKITGDKGVQRSKTNINDGTRRHVVVGGLTNEQHEHIELRTNSI